MKILFITANRVGDAVLTTGLLAHLERAYPDAAFTVACGPFGADIFQAMPRLERLIVMKKRRYNLHWLDLWKQCFSVKWDLIVDMRNSAVSRLLRTKKLAVHSKGRGEHKVAENAAVLGITPPPDPFIWLLPEAEKEADSIVPPGTQVIAFGSAANWAPKQWPIENFISLAKLLTASDGIFAEAKVMILADAHERGQIEPFVNAIPSGQRIEVVGKRLQVAAACLKRASLYVGNDSGLMHLAAALGVPTLGLFGPGFPQVYGPWGAQTDFVCTDESREELMAILEKTGDAKGLMRSLTVQRALGGVQGILE